MDARTLEQVIMDVARNNWSAFVDKPAASEAIATAVREWMLDTPGAVFHDRIKELEAEVERLKAMTYLPSNEAIDKAAKYDAIRARFPYLPGDEFYVADKGAIRRRSVYRLYANVRIEAAETAMQLVDYDVSQCHPTAEACRAAIPVEE